MRILHAPYAPKANNYKHSVRRCSGALLLLAAAALMAACGSAETTGVGVASVSASSVGLAWDPVPGANLAGYRVYYGTTSGGPYLQLPGQGSNAGNGNSYTVSGLQRGTTYYFAVTAYDTTNNETGFSNEVFKAIP